MAEIIPSDSPIWNNEEITTPLPDPQNVVLDASMADIIPEPGTWSEAVREWWNNRRAERGTPPYEEDMPRPFLRITADLASQTAQYGLNEPGYITFLVHNGGHSPSTLCHVEVYEGPGGYEHPLSAYSLRGSKVVSLQAGERRHVTLPWIRRRPGESRLVGLCYDPLLDPFTLEQVVQVDRHITSIHFDVGILYP